MNKLIEIELIDNLIITEPMRTYIVRKNRKPLVSK